MKYLITGGTGFIGQHLTNVLLEKEGNEVVILSRSAKKSSKPGLSFLKWDSKTIPDEAGEPDVVYNLAGASLADNRWTDEYKKIIIDSRVNTSRACVEFINSRANKPKVFMAGSAIGYFGGNPGNVLLDESGPAGNDFMADVCVKWEEASTGADVRTVFLRTGVVLGSEGGALEQIKKPYEFFVGGPIAGGDQGFPWIHLKDWIDAALFLEEQPTISGPAILVAPNFTTQQAFSDALAKVLSRPNFFPVPKFALDLLLGEASVIAWGGYKLKPGVLEDAGYDFSFPEIQGALKDLLG